MLHIVNEIVLPFDAKDLADWTSGIKSKYVIGNIPSHVQNQPAYHFGEYFVLSHFAKLGWSGHRFYALSDWEPNNPKLADGRTDLAKCFSANRLAAFRRERQKSGRADGKGEPDVFLFKSDGQSMFLEIKKGADRVFSEQLECLAQIRSILGAEVGIVYVRENMQRYDAKRYELNLDSYAGREIPI